MRVRSAATVTTIATYKVCTSRGGKVTRLGCNTDCCEWRRGERIVMIPFALRQTDGEGDASGDVL